MDTLKADKENILKQLNELDDNFIEFGNQDADFYEKVATADETTLDQYLELGK